MKRSVLTLASICLNEEEFIEAWLAYHYHAFDRLILCEGATRDYPREFVTASGLSTDQTAAIIDAFPDPERKILFIQHGWAGPERSNDTRVPAKMELRNCYAEYIESGYALTLDIDEFLHPYFLHELVGAMEESRHVTACAIPQLHLWQNTSQFITGGYADVPHYRMYRWVAGSRYVVNHNWPSTPDGELLARRGVKPKLQVAEGKLTAPALIHYGFCEDKRSMQQKNLYYQMRGEDMTRPATSSFRNAALEGKLPDGCVIHPYEGFLPFFAE